MITYIVVFWWMKIYPTWKLYDTSNSDSFTTNSFSWNLILNVFTFFSYNLLKNPCLPLTVHMKWLAFFLDKSAIHLHPKFCWLRQQLRMSQGTVLPEKLTTAYLVKKSATFFTGVQQCSVPLAKWIQSTSSHPFQYYTHIFPNTFSVVSSLRFPK